MEPPPERPRRKHKFTPKAPPKRATPILPKTDNKDEDKEADAAAKRMVDRFKDNAARRKSILEKKASVQVAFGHGASSGISIRSFGPQKDESAAKISESKLKDLATGEKWEIDLPSSLTDDDHQNIERSSAVSLGKAKKDYLEPWDYNSNYPTVLPLRRPHSGDPEILDEAEFGDSAQNMECDEDGKHHAKNLGLLDEVDKDQMMFFQFPNLPVAKQQSATASRKGKEKVGSSTQMEDRRSSKRGDSLGSLEELPEGHLGKLLVYKSGAVKLKVGDMLHDVAPGVDCSFAQEVVAINPVDGRCCGLGDIDKKAVVTPDIDSLLKNATNLELNK